MEKESNSQYYLPFPPARLVKTKDFIKEVMEPAGSYNSKVKPNKFLTKFISELHDFSEDNFGETNVFEQSDYYLPPKWQIVADYLKEKRLIQGIYQDKFLNDEPKFYRFSISSPLDPILTDGNHIKQNCYGHGDSLNPDDALASAFGEFLERYPLAIYREKDLSRFSALEIKKKGLCHLDINDLAGFSEAQKEQNPALRFDEKTQFFWAEGKNLLNDKKALIPAQLVFWNYNLYHKNWKEPTLREINTNGAGGHCTLTQAILSGIYEVIQRDGFLIYWLNHQAPPQIDPTSIKDPESLSLIEQCKQLGLSVKFFNTTSDLGIPSCLCIVIDDYEKGPKLAPGAGCGADWGKVIRRSLTEALSIYHWIYKNFHSEKEGTLLNKYYLLDEENYEPFKQADLKQDDRLCFWANKDRFKFFDFFLQGKMQAVADLERQYPKFSSPEGELANIREKFERMGKGYEAYFYQAKNKALDDLGYYSVKVIIPQLVSLYLRENDALLGAKRLKEVPEKLGFKAAEKFNPWPHPFP